MQAILKSKHQRFCNWLLGIKEKLEIRDDALEGMENELFDYYNLYMQKREELRTIIQHYEEKQHSIRNKVKLRRSLPTPSNPGS